MDEIPIPRPDHATYRLRVALRVCLLLQETMRLNGNQYHAGLVPNFTSLTDALSCPFEMLLQAIRDCPSFNPDLDSGQAIAMFFQAP